VEHITNVRGSIIFIWSISEILQYWVWWRIRLTNCNPERQKGRSTQIKNERRKGNMEETEAVKKEERREYAHKKNVASFELNVTRKK
jgi:hypothetical protein